MKVLSHAPAPLPPKETLYDALLDSADRYGHRDFLVIGRRSETISFVELAYRAGRFAAVLNDRGVRPGDRVALWMTNHVDWPVAAFAIARLGAVMVAVSTRLVPREVAHVIRLSDARLLVMEDLFLGRINALPILRCAIHELANTGDPQPEVIMMCRSDAVRDEHTDWTRAEACAIPAELPLSRVLSAGAGGEANPELTGVAAILTTSGTTGAPKGVMLTHDGLLRLARSVAARQELGPGERFYSIAPFFHCSGFMHGLLTNLVAGSTYFAPNVYDPLETIDVIRAERVSAYHGFIEPLQYMADAGLEPDDLTHLDRAWYSAPADRMAALERSLGVKMCEVYGLTETGGNISICTSSDPIGLRHDSDGRPHEGLELRIVDTASGAELAEGAEGEIQVRGWNVMRGYFRDAEETARAFLPGGWLATGDQGQVLPGGYVRFTGRLKDIIRVGGENLSPIEVENVLLGHPEVLEAAVVAAPDPRLVEVPVAFLRLRNGSETVPLDIESYCQTRLAGFKVPRRFVAVMDFPRTGATNRIQKAKLRKRLSETEGAV